MTTGRELTQTIKNRLTDGLATRFAPAPTGALHIGHVVNAVYVWGLARALDGRVILRIEDHDRQRSRTAWERQLLDDLDWLGFTPDVYPTDAYRSGACDGRQSERDAVYRGALAPLVAQGLVYGCRCTRATNADDATSSSITSIERRYPGTCRDAGIPLGDGVGWRLRIDPGLERFDDGLMGRQEQEPAAQCGDLLLRDRLGNWTYQCVAAIDDAVQGVTLVVRGQDLLASTGRQMRLARLIGRAEPASFVHHPLVMKSGTQKLSKSDGDTGIGNLRAAGWSADRIIARAVVLAGLSDTARSMSAAELPGLFRVSTDDRRLTTGD
jgi:glutamyl/glutaminyl-tRNA synthetase